MSTEVNRQALATPGSGWNLQSCSPGAEDIKELYGALTDRERTIGKLLDETNSQRGLPALDKIDRLIRIKDALPILEDVPDYALRECFKRAVKQHDYRHPFQMSEVAAAWRELPAVDKESLYSECARSLPAGPICDLCNGSGLMRLRIVGCHWPRRAHDPYILESVAWDWPGDTNIMAKCKCRESKSHEYRVMSGTPESSPGLQSWEGHRIEQPVP
jgi:hypothetical protein